MLPADIEPSIADIPGNCDTLPAVALLITDEGGGQIELARESYEPGKRDEAIATVIDLARVQAEAIVRRLTVRGTVLLPEGVYFHGE